MEKFVILQSRGIIAIKSSETRAVSRTKMIQFYNLKIHKLNHAEDPLATSASGLSTVSIKKIN